MGVEFKGLLAGATDRAIIPVVHVPRPVTSDKLERVDT